MIKVFYVAIYKVYILLIYLLAFSKIQDLKRILYMSCNEALSGSLLLLWRRRWVICSIFSLPIQDGHNVFQINRYCIPTRYCISREVAMTFKLRNEKSRMNQQILQESILSSNVKSFLLILELKHSFWKPIYRVPDKFLSKLSLVVVFF